VAPGLVLVRTSYHLAEISRANCIPRTPHVAAIACSRRRQNVDYRFVTLWLEVVTF
jgi:hypothetical protein